MKKINILITAIVLIATTVNAQQDWKDPQCNKKHIIDGSSWEGILKGGSECKCNLMDLWSSQYHKDTTTLVWEPNNPGIDWKKIILEDTTSTIYHIQLPELECNICDSITLINPDKQKRGEWILDFRKTRNLVGEWENTRWKYTYGNNPGNFYDRNFVPDTLVACVWSETVESTKCCSKWAWDGLSWKKQKPVTLKQAKSYIEFPNLQSKLKQSKRKK